MIGFIVGAAQTELAGPLARPGDTRAYPHIEALSHIIAGTSVDEDFDRGLRNIATRRPRKRR